MSISRDTIYTIQMLSGTSSDEKPTDVKSGSTFKEIDTGKNYIFDGATWVLQPGAGGASDPVLENAKSTGGIGWTEQGEQTVITWDGDTEGRDVLTIINSERPDVVVAHLYKVAEYSSKQFTENCELFAAGSQQSVSLHTYDHAVTYSGDLPLAIRTDGTDFDIQNVGTVHAESSGVYFINMGSAYVESLTYGTPDTVHKIDEKYLPVIPAAPSDDGTYTLTCTVTDGEPVYSWESAT